MTADAQKLVLGHSIVISILLPIDERMHLLRAGAITPTWIRAPTQALADRSLIKYFEQFHANGDICVSERLRTYPIEQLGLVQENHLCAFYHIGRIRRTR
ncbi:hypothetical protein ACHAXA_010176 [Cyclostephanos tholiformis]|uniref:Uncharacterized protein n=1 Tax=Cyclostephanos tholiformis TaxID=382380 RepID=A0ABD3RBY2_9STRA